MRKLESKVMRKTGRYMLRAGIYNQGGTQVGYKIRVSPEPAFGLQGMKVYRDRGFQKSGEGDFTEVWRPATMNWPSIGAQPVEIAKLFGSLIVFMADLGKRLNECGQETAWEQFYIRQMAKYAAIHRKAVSGQTSV